MAVPERLQGESDVGASSCLRFFRIGENGEIAPENHQKFPRPGVILTPVLYSIRYVRVVQAVLAFLAGVDYTCITTCGRNNRRKIIDGLEKTGTKKTEWGKDRPGQNGSRCGKCTTE